MAMADMNVRDDDAPYESGSVNQSPCIYLTDAQCKALGITSPPRAGTEMSLQAQVVVTSATESVDGDADDPDVCLTLCLTHISLGTATSAPDPISLYGSAGGGD